MKTFEVSGWDCEGRFNKLVDVPDGANVTETVRASVDESATIEYVSPADGSIMKTNNEPARLDPNGTEQPKTVILGSFKAGNCIGPGSSADSYTIKNLPSRGPEPKILKNPKNVSVAVIISDCYWDSHKSFWMVWGERKEESFSSLSDAMKKGDEQRAKGKSVLVRPNYNEEDEQGRFFREWRSFDGELFKEVIFRI